MMKKEEREAKDAFRLLHLHDWSASRRANGYWTMRLATS